MANILKRFFQLGVCALAAGFTFPSFAAGTVSTANESSFNSAFIGGGNVTLAVNGTITFTSTKVITNNTLIDGTGYNIKLSGGNAVRLFQVQAGKTLTLSNVVIADGRAVDGAGIYNSGTVRMYHTVMTNNNAVGSASQARGGAIYNIGTLEAYNSTYLTNTARGPSGNSGSSGSSIGNSNGGNGTIGYMGFGGAIYNTGSFSGSHCLFSNNIVRGGIGGSGGNGAPTGDGFAHGGLGGDAASGKAASGGAIYNIGNVALENTSLIANQAIGGNGGNGGNGGGSSGSFVGGDGGDGASGGESLGGAISNTNSLSLINCTFGENLAIAGVTGNGGKGGSGTFETCVSGDGGDGGNASSGYGGAIHNGGTIISLGVTFAHNKSQAGAAGNRGSKGSTSFSATPGLDGNVGASATSKGHNIETEFGFAHFENTFFEQGDQDHNVWGEMSDGGYNLATDYPAGYTNLTSFGGADDFAYLGPLGYWGGPTPTYSLLPNSPAINAGGSDLALFTDQRGYHRPDRADIGAFEYNGSPSLLHLVAEGPTASEDGDVGVFTIHRLGETSSAITVNLSVTGGTAVNGTDYLTISNTVLMAAGQSQAFAFVRPLSDMVGDDYETVMLNLLAGTNYGVGSDTNAVITIREKSTFDSSKRFVRGTSTASKYHSFVIPLDFQKGIKLDNEGGNATNIFPGISWNTTYYHYNATNPASQTNLSLRIPFKNPIVAFGDRVGGSRLNIGTSYDFAIYAGDTMVSPGLLDIAISIRAYWKTNFALADFSYIPIPDFYSANVLNGYATNGFVFTTNLFGLNTTVIEQPYADWDTLENRTYILSHTATSESTNYIYEIAYIGYADVKMEFPMVELGNSVESWSKLYTMEFDAEDSLRPAFIDQPHFSGKPLPPEYQNKSLAELTSMQPMLPALTALTPTNFLSLNNSPELRNHPILNQFVTDMRKDPLALANYVLNEIELVDGLDYNTNQTSQPAISLGGVSRSALAVYQEGQGSPAEQCALLVYLLRQAGVPTVYLYPTNNGLQLLDAQVSKLLGFQVKGALNSQSRTNIPELIAVNYPWVAAYIGTNWVHVFPWLKDTEIIEGLDLYDYMPTNYNSGYKWAMQYLAGNTNIFSLSDSDQVGELFPRFVQKQLDANFNGLSVGDMGFRMVNRRNLYSKWADFPKPFALSGSPMAVTNLNAFTNIFDTIQVRAYSVSNTNKYIDTGELLMADFHNRKIQLRYDQVGGGNTHNMILSANAYDSAITNNAVFGTTNVSWRLAATNQLDSSDDYVMFKVTHRKLKRLPSNFDAFSEPSAFGYISLENDLINETNRTVSVKEFKYRKGDLVAFCMHVGEVSDRMLNVHAEDLWRFEREADTNSLAYLKPDVYQGTTAYLMGMSYFKYDADFVNECRRLHKIRFLNEFRYGFSILGAKRGVDGQLVNGGNVILTTPTIDIPMWGYGIAFNGTLRPDSGRDSISAYQNAIILEGLHSSAAEHGIIESFYRTNAVSTVRLLHLVGANNFVRLNRENWEQQGEVVYGGQALKLHDTAMWERIKGWFNDVDDRASYFSQAILTPGMVTNGTYVGMGAFLVSFDGTSGLISGILHGGEGRPVGDITFSQANVENIGIRFNPAGEASPFYLTTVEMEDSLLAISAGSTTWNTQETYDLISTGDAFVDPTLALSSSLVNQVNFNLTGSVEDGWQVMYDNGVLGNALTIARDSALLVADPVNIVTGEFYADIVDLSLPGPMPLQVRRNYSSHNIVENEFGFGWKWNYMPFLSVTDDNETIYAADPEGSIIAYEQTGTNANVWLPQVGNNPHLSNKSDGGIGSTANPYRNRIVKTSAGGTNTFTLSTADGSIRTFIERSFLIGSSFSRLRPYLTKWQDNRGNFYTFEFGQDSLKPDYGKVRRIQSSNGNYLGFYYDVYGHVIEAYTGDGRRISYEYDRYGDLVRVTLPDMSEQVYEYKHASFTTNSVTQPYSTHLISREIKPDGRLLINEYDAHRRVTNQLSTVGADLNPIRNATFAYANNFTFTNSVTNRITGYTTISDVFNNVTRYDYTNSLITKIDDPVNPAIEQQWYADNATIPGYPRSLWKVKDKRGLWTEFKYDQFGNVTNTVITGDLTGEGITAQTATNVVIYNTNNLPVESIDSAGNKLKTVYHSTYPFLPDQVIRYAGASPVSTNKYSYYNVTNTFVTGGVTYTNVSRGLLQQQIAAFNSDDAATNTWSHDGRGFILQSIQYTRTTDPNVTNVFFYNDRGEMVERLDSAGRKLKLSHDAMGRPMHRELYESGQTIPASWEYSYYNENGEPTWSDGPRFDPEDYVWRDYDGAGRQTQEIRWRSQAKSNGSGVEAVPGDDLYAVTFHEYDGFGNPTNSIDPRGNYLRRTYDAIGQLLREIAYDASGTPLTTNRFAYEPGGQVSLHTNALGGVTTNFYTYTGKLMRRQNADGSTNRWIYYLDGRTKREILPNGSYNEFAYDDLNRLQTTYFKNSGGTTHSTETKQFDRRGNLLSVTDPLANIFSTTYDGLNRVKTSVGPSDAVSGQQRMTNYYDAAGVIQISRNAIGDKTSIRNDALGRPVETSVATSANVTNRLTRYVYATNHHAVTKILGAGTTAMTNTTFTDTFGQTVIEQFRPTSEYRLSIYDPAGNLIASRDEIGRTNSYLYDGLNRLRISILPDGAGITNTYNGLGNVTLKEMPGGRAVVSLFDTAGRVRTNWLRGTSSGVTRGITNTYHTTGPVGLLYQVKDARGLTHTTSYDDWIRVQTVVTTGGATEQNVATTNTYDVLGRLTLRNQATGSDLSSVERQYDSYGQVIDEKTYLNGGLERWMAQKWNTAGRRSELKAPGGGYGSVAQFGYRSDGLMTHVIQNGQFHSFAYGDNGLITSRTNVFRNASVVQRDARGRLTQTSLSVGGTTHLAETLSWRADSTLDSYYADRTGSWDEARDYVYNDRGQLLSEEVATSGSDLVTLDYGFDTAKLGVRTSATQSGAMTNRWLVGSGGQPDQFGRLTQEQLNMGKWVQRARGSASGAQSVVLTLDGNAVSPVEYDSTDVLGNWEAPISFGIGSHTLIATATHPWNGTTNYLAKRTNTFSAQASTTIDQTYDALGNTTNRIYTGNRTNLLTWDGAGRLLRVVERVGSTTNYIWTAKYDALGRRLLQTETRGGISTQIGSWYDPQVEYLEVGVSYDGEQTWKIHGPDLNGVYGGLQGIGGAEATVRDADGLATGLLTDFFGNAMATTVGATMIWNDVPWSGYGALLGYEAPRLSANVTLATATGWQQRRPDITGLYYMGARYYDPAAGKFLSPDPLGHNASMDLYSYAYGDPINYLDPDGRFGRNAFIGATQGDFATEDTGVGGMVGQTALGFIPIAGQVGDFRDTAAAFNNMGDGGWKSGGNWLNLAAVGVAWVPGFDWVKSSDNVVRQLDNAPLSHSTHVAELPITDNHLAVSGQQWNDYFSSQYGSQNVEWVGGLEIAPYNVLRRDQSIPGQAHHLNQNAAYNEVIPIGEGISTKLEGNAFTDVGSPHYNAHESLEGFWNQYRPGGARYGEVPTNLEYTSALADSLRKAGKNPAEVRQAVGEAVQQRVDYGLLGGEPVPAIPGRINQTPRP